MAKTTTVTRKIDIVDLIRNRKNFALLDIPAIRVSFQIEVTTSALTGTPAPAPSSKLDRLEKAARAKLDEYKSIISSECDKFDKR